MSEMERQMKNQERDLALKRAAIKRKEKTALSKQLDKRTKKGQPFMNARMKMLLGKIESNPDKYKS